MKKNVLARVLVLFVFAAFMVSMSSCNKGYGCPTNFKAAKAIQCAVQLVK